MHHEYVSGDDGRQIRVQVGDIEVLLLPRL